jgi:Kef-type K+ transport system membrane component KefB
MADAAWSAGSVAERGLGGTRLGSAYVVLAALLAGAIGLSVAVGHSEHAPPTVAGEYRASGCLGHAVRLTQSGQFVSLGGTSSGQLRLQHGLLSGSVHCAGGGTAHLALQLASGGSPLRFAGTVGGRPETITLTGPLPQATAAKPVKRSSEETFGRLMLAIAAVILAARLVGAATGRLGQPRVMGEVLAGILLGPSLLGSQWPAASRYLFPSDIVPLLSGAAQIGLAFYLFLVGMELDPRTLRRRVGQAALISNASVAVPMALGFLVALPVYKLLAPDVRYLPFALFMGVAMSITAFPVLARILLERRMLRNPVGALALAGAAIDDVTAWCLLALATAVAGTGSSLHVVRVVALAALFVAAMVVVARPLLGRVSHAYDEVGHVPTLWIGIIFVSVLLSAYVSQQIGIAAIFGAFVVGLIMPRHAGLTRDVSGRVEDFVVTVLLPLFFVVTGLKTHIGSLNRPVLWLVTLLLIAVAITGKWAGALAAARYGGLGWRDSTALGALMNTRGLTELIVLNIGLDLGVISSTLFTMLVVMALVTTFMAGPALRLIDPRGELSAPPDEDLRREREALAAIHSVIVAPQDERNLEPLLAIAEPLAASIPPRELILVEALVPDRFATGAILDGEDVTRANARLQARRAELAEHGVQARATAFTSADRDEDYLRLAQDPNVDLLLLDGRRPLVGEGVPRGFVGRVLQEAPCDVAVLIEQRDGPAIDLDHPVCVPFGGADYDWAALELGAWIAAAHSAPLRLVGAAARLDRPDGDASRLLGHAGLVVQQLAGIVTESVLADLAGEGLLESVEGAGLIVMGLSDRYRHEGLGKVRSTITRTVPAPILLVRRGTRPGALSSRDTDLTRFSWSLAGAPS